jgi:hypothetical protein
MTTYRLMDGAGSPTRPGNGPSSSTSYAGNFLAGVLFSVTGGMYWLDGYYWWVCNTGQSTAAQKFALWNRYGTASTSQSLVSGSVVTSGTLTAGAWNYVPLAAPLQLAPGGLYIAATGWVPTSGNGFPDTNNQFGSGQTYASGITNGPLTAWSDLGASHLWQDGASGNNSMDQGLFSTAGSDPSVNCPNGGSNSANFWMDVLVDTAPPSGYSGSYRIWPNRTDLGNYTNDTANNFTLGMEFSLSQACTVNNVWFYSPSGVSQLPTEIGVYNVSTTTLVASNSSPSWSGAAGSGWVKAALTASLAGGTNYKVVVLNGAGSPSVWNGAVASYWSTGFGGSGLTSGPITVPNNATATSPGQSSYNLGSAIAYPNTNAGPYNYGVDIEVTPATGVTGTAAFTGTGTFTPGGQFAGAAVLAGTASFTPGARFSGAAGFSGTAAFAGGGGFAGGQAMSGAGTFSAGGNFAASAPLTGTATLSAGASQAAAAGWSGTGAFAAAAKTAASAAMDGEGALAGTYGVSIPGAAGMSGSGSFAAPASLAAGCAMDGEGALTAGQQFAVAAALAGISTFAAGGALAGGAALSGESTLSAGPGQPGSAGMTGTGQFGAESLLAAAAAFSGTGTLSAPWTVSGTAGAALDGEGAFAASYTQAYAAAAAMSGVSTLTAQGSGPLAGVLGTCLAVDYPAYFAAAVDCPAYSVIAADRGG